MKKPTTPNGAGSRIHIHHTYNSIEDKEARSVLRSYYYRHIRYDRSKFLSLITNSKQTLACYDVFVLYSHERNRFFDKPGKALTYAWRWQQYGHFIRIWKREDGLHFRAVSFDDVIKAPTEVLTMNRKNLTRKARSLVLQALKEKLLIDK